MTVKKKGDVLLEGIHNGAAGMWQVQPTPPNISPTPTHQSENNLMAVKTNPELEQCYHADIIQG